MHIKSDGNGSFVVSKGAMAFSILIITIISILGSVIAYATTVKGELKGVISDVDELTDDIAILEDKGVKLRLDSETQWSVISSKLQRIEEDIKEIKLDIKISLAPKAEGVIRDLIRFVQGMRKDGGLKPGDKIYFRYSTSLSLNKLIQKQIPEIKKEVSANQIEAGTKRKESFLVEKEVELDGQKIWLGIRNL